MKNDYRCHQEHTVKYGRPDRQANHHLAAYFKKLMDTDAYNKKCVNMGLPTIDYAPLAWEIKELNEQYSASAGNIELVVKNTLWQYRIGGEKYKQAIEKMIFLS